MVLASQTNFWLGLTTATSSSSSVSRLVVGVSDVGAGLSSVHLKTQF